MSLVENGRLKHMSENRGPDEAAYDLVEIDDDGE